MWARAARRGRAGAAPTCSLAWVLEGRATARLWPCPSPTKTTPAGFGIRLNKKAPEITFRKKDKGGINYTSTVQNPKLDLEGGCCCPLAGGLQTVAGGRAGGPLRGSRPGC